MKASAVLFALLPVLASAKDEVRGVDPAFAESYDPAQATFTCLDGRKTIPYSAVNDDYCDCDDGSDEPGTSACEGMPRAYFYCKNEGHIPARILSSRVNDGICEPECCDGSDEWMSGACPNRCAEIAKEHKERVELEAKTRRTGAKLRGSYVQFAEKEKTRLLDEVASKKAQLATAEVKVAETKAALDAAEAQSRDDLERRKQSPMYKALEEHRDAATRLRDQLNDVKADLSTVLAILDELSRGYNPNGQDMAVKAAVVGYKELIGKTDDAASDEAKPDTEGTDEAKPDEGAVAKLNTVRDPVGKLAGIDVDRILRTDLESLLVSNDNDDDDDLDEDGLLYRFEEYIPDSMFEYYDAAREAFVEFLYTVGILKKKQSVVNDGPHVVAARQRSTAAQTELNNLRNDIQNSESTLDKLTTKQWYGPAGEWKKLDGTCIETVAGDYTYELCFFGTARQKSNKDSSSNTLGTFAEWNKAAEPGQYDYYTKMAYRNGAKCWNGPNRSVNVELSCGKENAILSVTEPEKCEYKFKATSPALCWPLEGHKAAKDEL